MFPDLFSSWPLVCHAFYQTLWNQVLKWRVLQIFQHRRCRGIPYPVKEELQTISAILDCFEKASGLITNMSKTEIFLVRCDGIDLQDILSAFPTRIATFPEKYLGLPLHFCCLRKVDLQSLIDKTAAKLPIWMGKNLARPGRVMLAKTVLMAISTLLDFALGACPQPN